jgi:uncharacterized protein YecT (DUF1311 family)
MAQRDETCDATKIAVPYAKLCVMEMTATRTDELTHHSNLIDPHPFVESEACD